MASLNIQLNEDDLRTVHQLIAKGGYSSAGEVVSAGLRALGAESASGGVNVDKLRAELALAEEDFEAGRTISLGRADEVAENLRAMRADILAGR